MVGEFKLRPRLPLLSGLIRTIISQQLGEPAAWTLYKRFLNLYPNSIPTAVRIHETPITDITHQGISRAKATVVKQLASDIHSKKLSLRNLSNLDNEKIIETLTNYVGIGEWTANIFLMFSLGRIDVLPMSDLALRRAIIRAYKISQENDAAIQAITSKWNPYRTIASWYLWRSLGINSI